ECRSKEALRVYAVNRFADARPVRLSASQWTMSFQSRSLVPLEAARLLSSSGRRTIGGCDALDSDLHRGVRGCLRSDRRTDRASSGAVDLAENAGGFGERQRQLGA